MTYRSERGGMADRPVEAVLEVHGNAARAKRAVEGRSGRKATGNNQPFTVEG